MGVLNFAFGSIAYTVAYVFYFLNSQHGWPILPAALLSLLVFGPALGYVLYALLFRHLSTSSTLVKIMATIGVSVALPPAVTLVFGLTNILEAPGLAPNNQPVFSFFGVPIGWNQIIVYAFVVALLLIGFILLRYTDIGLQIRALVDSPAMTSLSGVNPGRLSAAVWTVSSALAGLVGVLVAPTIGLDANDMTLLMIAEFAAVIAGKLRSLPIAAVVGLSMGIITAVLQYALPPESLYTSDALNAVPFVLIAVFLIYYTVRGQVLDEGQGVGGALDQAIRPQGQSIQVLATGSGGPGSVGSRRHSVSYACWVFRSSSAGFGLGSSRRRLPSVSSSCRLRS